MSDTTTIRSLTEHIGEAVLIRGWVRNHRSSGKIAFLIIRDGTGETQVVAARHDVDDETWDTITGRIAYETSVLVEGTVQADARSPGGVEVTATRIEVIGDSSNDYPIQLKEAGVDFLLSQRHLWLRTPRQTAIMRIRDEVVRAIRDFMYEREFVLVDTPILTGSIGESAGTLFETDYFDLGQAYLAQTGQLYAEAAAAVLGGGSGGVCFQPHGSRITFGQIRQGQGSG